MADYFRDTFLPMTNILIKLVGILYGLYWLIDRIDKHGLFLTKWIAIFGVIGISVGFILMDWIMSAMGMRDPVDWIVEKMSRAGRFFLLK